MTERWVLRVAFDTAENSRLTDSWVNGEATAFVSTLREMWAGATDDEFTDDVTVARHVVDPEDRGDTDVFADVVYATADLVDQLVDPVNWVIMHTVPMSLQLERVIDRGR